MGCPLLISSRSHPCGGLPLPDQHIGPPKLMDDLLGRISLLRHRPRRLSLLRTLKISQKYRVNLFDAAIR